MPAKIERDCLNNLVAASTVTMCRINEDRHGRLISKFSKDPMNIQKDLVEKDFASIYQRYANQCKWSKQQK